MEGGDQGMAYHNAREDFITKGGVGIRVHWIVHPSSKRTINLIFTNHPIWATIQLFDVPMCRAALWGFKNKADADSPKLYLQYDPVVLEDLTSRKMTAPPAELVGKGTPSRVAKYLARYGMEMR